MLQPDIHRLGEIRPGVVKRFHFYVQNTTSTVRTVNAVKVACKICTNVKLSAKRIPTGGRIKADVTFDSSGYSGQQKRWIRLLFSDGQTLIFHYTAHIFHVLEVDPRIVRLKASDITRPLQRTIQLMNPRKKPITITSCRVKSKGKRFVTIDRYPRKLLPGKSGKLVLTIRQPEGDNSVNIQSLIIDTDFVLQKQTSQKKGKTQSYRCYVSVTR